MYGQRFFNRLAQELNKPYIDGFLLTQCYRLVKTYSEEEYRRLSQLEPLSPTHLLMLTGVDDPKSRRELIDRVVAERMTTRALWQAIKNVFGVRRLPGAGRPLKRPKSVKEALTHMRSQGEKLCRLNNEAWFGEQFDLGEEITNLPAAALTDDVRTQITDTAEQCEQLAKTAAASAKALRAVLPELDRRRAAQAEVDAQVAAAEAALQSS